MYSVVSAILQQIIDLWKLSRNRRLKCFTSKVVTKGKATKNEIKNQDLFFRSLKDSNKA